jgi:hypothetical protein
MGSIVHGALNCILRFFFHRFLDRPDPRPLTSLVFGAALLLNVLVKLWLASRQIRAVARHRGAVPAEFARAIPLAPTSAPPTTPWRGCASACWS